MDRAELHFRSYTDDQATHSHPYQQILLASEGRMELEIAGTGGLVHGGQGAIVESGETHAFRGIGRNSILVLDVPEADVSELGGLTNADKGFFAVPPALHHLVRFLTLERQPGTTAAIMERMAPMVISTLASQLRRGALDCPARVRRAFAFMHHSYDAPISGQDIAEAAGLSMSRLHVLFRLWAGQSPRDYLTDVRLAKAREYLAGTEDSIAQIAVAVGYGDQSALTHIFRKRLKTTPAAYRRAIRARHSRPGLQ